MVPLAAAIWRAVEGSLRSRMVMMDRKVEMMLDEKQNGGPLLLRHFKPLQGVAGDLDRTRCCARRARRLCRCRATAARAAESRADRSR